MKTIRVSEELHQRIFDSRNSKRKSAEAVINGLFNDNRVLKNELLECITNESMILSDEAAEIIKWNLKRVGDGLECIKIEEE